MSEIKNAAVAEKFAGYPGHIGKKLLFLRRLILETAAEATGSGEVEESLKWGEPGYLGKSGSTIRIDWKASNPDSYAMYFHCNTTLVDTFKELFGDRFEFEGNRAIVFNLNDRIPVNELKQCISMALTYHRIKHLPLLGA